MDTLKGAALICTFIGVLTIFAEATPMKIGLVAFTTTLMLAGASHAADKITLICSDGKGQDDYSLSVDLDRKLASFHMSALPDADDIPVIRVTDNYIWFQNKATVVGTVETPGGGDRRKSKDQPHAKQITHAPEPAMWRTDEKRKSVPVGSDAERPMPIARRTVPRRSEG